MTTNFDRRIWMDEMFVLRCFFFLEHQQLYLITIPNLVCVTQGFQWFDLFSIEKFSMNEDVDGDDDDIFSIFIQ